MLDPLRLLSILFFDSAGGVSSAVDVRALDGLLLISTEISVPLSLNFEERLELFLELLFS